MKALCFSHTIGGRVTLTMTALSSKHSKIPHATLAPPRGMSA
jgi:hypothetical protein